MRLLTTTIKTFVILIFALCVFSCTSAEERELRRTYAVISDAVLSNNTALIEEHAPFLAQSENREALIRLQQIIAANPAVIVQHLSAHYAILKLSEPADIMLPFIRNDAGGWILSSTVQQTQTIEFIPSAEK